MWWPCWLERHVSVQQRFGAPECDDLHSFSIVMKKGLRSEMFLHRLSEQITCELPQTLGGLINLAIWVDSWLQDQQTKRRSLCWTNPVRPVFTPRSSEHFSSTRTEVNCTWFSTWERLRQVAEKQCLYCAKLWTLPPEISSKKEDMESMDSAFSTSHYIMHTMVSWILWSQCQLHVLYLGQSIKDTHFGAPIKILISGNYHEEASFYVMKLPYIPMVLGRLWLVRYNPQIDWEYYWLEPKRRPLTCPMCQPCTMTSSKSLTSPKPAPYHLIAPTEPTTKDKPAPRHHAPQRSALFPVCTKDGGHGEVHHWVIGVHPSSSPAGGNSSVSGSPEVNWRWPQKRHSDTGPSVLSFLVVYNEARRHQVCCHLS